MTPKKTRCSFVVTVFNHWFKSKRNITQSRYLRFFSMKNNVRSYEMGCLILWIWVSFHTNLKQTIKINIYSYEIEYLFIWDSFFIIMNLNFSHLVFRLSRRNACPLLQIWSLNGFCHDLMVTDSVLISNWTPKQGSALTQSWSLTWHHFVQKPCFMKIKEWE